MSEMKKATILLLSVNIWLSGCGGLSDKDADLPEAVNLAAYQAGAAAGQSDPVVARVNGREIKKSALWSVLLRARGKAILEELVLLEVVRQRAEEARIEMEPNTVQKEWEKLLHQMGPDKSRAEQEALLEYMLKSRGLARQEFEIILERQALLQKLVDRQVEISEQELAREYERQHGRRVVVRHLGVRSLLQLEKAQRRLQAKEEFARVAQEMSQDEATLRQGGLWGPFSGADEQIPAAVRQAALGLEQVGQRSEPIRYRDAEGIEWWCLVQLEEIIEASGQDSNEVRQELTETIRQREINGRMLELQKQWKKQARIEIMDPILQKDDNR